MKIIVLIRIGQNTPRRLGSSLSRATILQRTARYPLVLSSFFREGNRHALHTGKEQIRRNQMRVLDLHTVIVVSR